MVPQRDGEQLDDGEGHRGTERRGVPRHQRIGLDPRAEGVDADVRHDPVEDLNGDEGQPHELRLREASRRASGARVRGALSEA